MRKSCVSYFEALITGLVVDSAIAAQGPSGTSKSRGDGVWRQNADKIFRASMHVEEKTPEGEFYLDQHGRIFAEAKPAPEPEIDRHCAELQGTVMLIQKRVERRKELMAHLLEECHCPRTYGLMEKKQCADQARLRKLKKQLRALGEEPRIVFTHDALPATSAALMVPRDKSNLN
ncbi:hypothetical protein KKD42_02625 [Patescibacteria group bacterium]|nr:hypothetical protein [Patescibacteria group bacterium]